MFDLTSSKLLLLAIVALLVVGPKDLPILLRTVGKYMGMIKRQAAEFRAQFDDAMRESELADLKKDVEGLGHDAESALRDAETSFKSEMGDAERQMNSVSDEVANNVDAVKWEEEFAAAGSQAAEPPTPAPAVTAAKPAEAAAATAPADKSGA